VLKYRPELYNSVLKQAGLKRETDMPYLVVIEQGADSYGGYVPDLPGCVAAAETKQEVLELIQAAIEFHLEGIQAEGCPVTRPQSFSEFVEVR
jgi:predicted RNase H-like HicB family nuclease